MLKYKVITCTLYGLFVCLFMLFNATFNNISAISSWGSVLLVESTGVTGVNHRPVASQSSTPRPDEIQTHNISGDMH